MKKFSIAALLLMAIPLAQAQVNAPVPYRASALTNTIQVIKSTRGVIQSGNCYNANGTPVYIQFYNMTGTPALGTTVPTFTWTVLPTTVANLDSVLNFSNAIKVAASTALSGSGTPASTLVCGFGFN